MGIGKKGFANIVHINTLALLAGLITFIVYLPALHNGFVTWDDNLYLYENSHIRNIDGTFFSWAFTEFYAGNWHPLTWLSHALDYAIWELNPLGHHLSSITLHSMNTLLVAVLAYQLLSLIIKSKDNLISDKTNLRFIAFITALLFGLHPLHVESVAWISERKDLLCAFFYLLSLLFYLHLKRNLPTGTQTASIYFNKSYLICLVMFMLALMSKPMAISLPLVLLLIDLLDSDDSKQETHIHHFITKAPFFLLALISAVVTIAAQKSGNAINSLEVAPLSDRLWVAGYALIAYLQKMVWPVDLLPYYAYPKSVDWSIPKYFGTALLVFIVTTVSVLSLRWSKCWIAAWGYYVITLIPVLGIVKVGSQAMADRYAYLPSFSPFLVLSVALVWIFCYLQPNNNKPTARPLLLFLNTAILIGLLSAFTIKQIDVWKDGETLWRYIIKYDDQIPLAYKQLGVSLYERAEYDGAVEAINKAVILNPLDAELINNLAICHLELGNLDKAMQATRRALSLEANNPLALNTLGEIYMARQDYTNANKSFLRAMQLEPKNPLRVFNLAISFDKLNDIPQACHYWRHYMMLDITGEDDAEIIKHLSKLGCPLQNP